MHPVLFNIGPITIYSYGVMLVLAFIAGFYFFSSEVKRKNLDDSVAIDITIIALFCGIIGSKLLFIIENFQAFLIDPLRITFSTGGFTFLGGLILSFIVSWIYIKAKKFNFLRAADAVAPSLILSYGIGRIGCHLAGDGDYGIPTSLPWGVNYENGIVPPTYLFHGTKYASVYPDNVFPNNTPLHPTPVYEFLVSALIFLFLWKFRKRSLKDGTIVMLYFILSSLSRFLVEFIRLNPRILFGLSEAQIIASVVFAGGIIGLILLYRSPASE
jgi:phosphatidylglycerol---prolipoprotein diacylglyceryl transferase